MIRCSNLGRVGLILTLSGCFAGSPDVPADFECSDNQGPSCDAGKVCVENQCKLVCSRASDCPPAETCVGGACSLYAAACTTRADCLDGWFCDEDSSCRKLRSWGSPCGDRNDTCESSYCVDGVCCDTACQGTCSSCLGAFTGATNVDGRCGLVTVGEDPDGECGDAACNGVGSCFTTLPGQPCGNGFECTSGFCADQVCCQSPCQGECEICTTGTCEPIPDGVDPSLECQAPTTCNGQRSCWSQELGDTCARDLECSSGHCADGVCCDAACDGLCVQCNNPAAPGTCSPVQNTEDDTCNLSIIGGACTVLPCVCNADAQCGSSGAVACLSGAQCASGSCLGGVCCETACSGNCMSCRKTETHGANDGLCLPVINGQDPLEACPGLLTCDGAGSCYPAWSGIKQDGTTTTDSAYGVGVDALGNVYVAGKTTGNMHDNANAGGYDLFLMKLSHSGVRQWTRLLGTTADDIANAVAVDGAGNAYVAGVTGGGLDANPPASYRDMFLVKYDTNGNEKWTRQLDGSKTTVANGVAVRAGTGAYVAGTTNHAFDGNTYADHSDAFLVKYSEDGVKEWSREFGTIGDEEAFAVATDNGGNVLVAGYVLVGSLDGNPNAGGKDAFVAKYSASGDRLWIRQLGSTGDDEAHAVAVDDANNAYVVGYTTGGLEGETNAGATDVFVAKYDSTGARIWTRQLGGSRQDEALGVTVSGPNTITIAGRTNGAIGGSTNIGGFDTFVVAYGTNGSMEWLRRLGAPGGPYWTIGYSIAADSTEDTYIAGYTWGQLPGTQKVGGDDLFVAKLGPTGTLQ